MESGFANVSGGGEQRAQKPHIERRMRVAAHVDQIAERNVVRVIGVQGFDLRVLGAVQVENVVALNGLMEKGNTQQ